MDAAVLIGLCAVGIVAGNLQNAARLRQKQDVFSTSLVTVIRPGTVPLAASTRAVNDFFRGLISARHLEAENRRLKELETPLALYSATVAEKDDEINRLRAMLQFGPVEGKKRIPASVIGFSINENRLTLNVGSAQGIKLGAPVESAQGLVGTVEELQSHECQVLMLTSAGLQMTSQGKTQLIGAIDVNRKPPLVGLVRGDNASTLSMTFLDPKAPVQVGDLIMTSGYSDKIPRGINIGKVIQVEPNEEFGTLKARIDPSFSPGSLDEVFVLI